MKVYPFFIPHAGCPHRCRFCQQQQLSGQPCAPTPEEVASQLSVLLPERGDGEVAFYGGSFTLLDTDLQKEYLHRVQPFLRHDRIAGIRVSTRPDAIDEKGAELLQGAGVTTVELGCQSFDAAVLDASCRGHGPEAAIRAVQLLRSRALRIGLQLMPGLPAGGRQEALLSLRRALDLQPDFLRIYPAVVLRATPLEEDFESGNYQPLPLEGAVELCAEMLWHCRQAGVPVIRLGLQATSALAPDRALVAGPYHPAFGALVRSRLWRRAIEGLLTDWGENELLLHSADLSDALGQRRCNFDYFEKGGRQVVIHCDDRLAREQFVLNGRSCSVQAAAAFPPLLTLG